MAGPAAEVTRVRPSEAFETVLEAVSLAFAVASPVDEACRMLCRWNWWRKNSLDWRSTAREVAADDIVMIIDENHNVR